jgi:hypothetical protein
MISESLLGYLVCTIQSNRRNTRHRPLDRYLKQSNNTGGRQGKNRRRHTSRNIDLKEDAKQKVIVQKSTSHQRFPKVATSKEEFTRIYKMSGRFDWIGQI